VRHRAEFAKPPSTVYEEPPIGVKLVRDLLNADVEKMTVDAEDRYKEIIAYLDRLAPHLKRKVELYRGEVRCSTRPASRRTRARVPEAHLDEGGGFITIDRPKEWWRLT